MSMVRGGGMGGIFRSGGRIKGKFLGYSLNIEGSELKWDGRFWCLSLEW